ncbi:MAG: hypothetical protein HYY13_09875 [Nitrospirae bacterium]|nr:hypothetical protein [Nitrospirota bacterium]
MLRKASSRTLALILGLAPFLPGCKKAGPPPEPAAAPESPAESLPSAAAPPPLPTYRYNPVEKRDPFQPYQEVPAVVSARDCGLKYPRENYRLVGILWGEVAVAAFEDEAGDGCFLRVGDLIGKEKAVIREVLYDHVVAVEKPFGMGAAIQHEMWLYEGKE